MINSDVKCYLFMSCKRSGSEISAHQCFDFMYAKRYGDECVFYEYYELDNENQSHLINIFFIGTETQIIPVTVFISIRFFFPFFFTYRNSITHTYNTVYILHFACF